MTGVQTCALPISVLRLPPLRERREDIPLLFEHFVRNAAERYGLPAPDASAERLRELMAHDWPGNVREVRNAADRFVLEGGDSPMPGDDGSTPVVPLAQQMERVEKALIEQALRRCQGRMQDVMQQLGTPKKTLYDKLHRHGIDPERFR